MALIRFASAGLGNAALMSIRSTHVMFRHATKVLLIMIATASIIDLLFLLLNWPSFSSPLIGQHFCNNLFRWPSRCNWARIWYDMRWVLCSHLCQVSKRPLHNLSIWFSASPRQSRDLFGRQSFLCLIPTVDRYLQKRAYLSLRLSWSTGSKWLPLSYAWRRDCMRVLSAAARITDLRYLGGKIPAWTILPTLGLL